MLCICCQQFSYISEITRPNANDLHIRHLWYVLQTYLLNRFDSLRGLVALVTMDKQEKDKNALGNYLSVSKMYRNDHLKGHFQMNVCKSFSFTKKKGFTIFLV